MEIKRLCSVYTDVEIDEGRAILRLKGREYARIDGGELCAILHGDEWIEDGETYENWRVYQKNVAEKDLSKIHLLAWLNEFAYNRLHDELKKLEVNDESGRKAEAFAVQMAKDYGAVSANHAALVRVHERETIRAAIDELQAWFRGSSLEIPTWQPLSEITQPLYDVIEKKEIEIADLKMDLAKQGALTELYRSEPNKVKVAPVKYSKKHFIEVDKLARTLKIGAAIEAVAEKYKFSFEGFKQQYYSRHYRKKRE